MTELDLDAIRARAKRFDQAGQGSAAISSAADVPVLIAEIERLRSANANLIRNAEVLADEVVLAHADRKGGE